MRLIKHTQYGKQNRIICLLCFLVLGMVIMCLFSEKSRIDIEEIAVSSDEQYLAFFETGEGYKIRCFHKDGIPAFVYDIPTELSAGGHCTLWFDDDTLFVLFDRTDKSVQLSMAGSVLGVFEENEFANVPQYSDFYWRKNEYIYQGKEINVIYNKGSFLDYWILGAERYLVVESSRGDKQIISSWSANAE